MVLMNLQDIGQTGIEVAQVNVEQQQFKFAA
jgi:hypothetical protein